MSIQFSPDSINAILEKVIVPAVEKQVINKTLLWSKVFGGWTVKNEETGVGSSRSYSQSSGKFTFANNLLYFPLQMSRNPNPFGISEGGVFPSKGTPTLTQGSLPITTSTNAFQISEQVLQLKDAGQVVNAVQFQMDELADSLALDFNRQSYGLQVGNTNGVVNGVLGFSGSTATAATLQASTTSSPVQITVRLKTGAANPFGDVQQGLWFFPVGTYFTVSSAGSTALYQVCAATGAQTATQISFSIVAGTAVALAVGDTLTKANQNGVASVEFNGLGDMLNTTSNSTYLNVSGTTYANWNPNVNTSPTASKLNMDDMQKLYLQAAIYGNCDVIIMNATLHRKYASLLTNLAAAGAYNPTNFNSQSDLRDTITGGYGTLEFMGGRALVVLDYYCPEDTVYFLNSQKLFRCDYSPFRMLPSSSGNFGQRLVDQLDYQIVGRYMGNLATNLRAAHGVITNITSF